MERRKLGSTPILRHITMKGRPRLKPKRTRITRIYPAWTFEQSLPLAEAIQKHASGRARLSSDSTQGNEQVTNGKYNSESDYKFVEVRFDDGRSLRGVSRAHARGTHGYKRLFDAKPIIETKFKLAIERIKPFQVLYDRFKGKRLPSHEVLADTLKESQAEITDIKECIDVFITNSRYLGLLQMLQGTEMLLTIEAKLNEVKGPARTPRQSQSQVDIVANPSHPASEPSTSKTSSKSWDTICFYISPIGQDDSEERKHSDLFLNYLIEPALKNFGLEVVRADKIGEAGLISAQILEHIIHARLAIVDLSFYNPNVFYEMAIRHACKLPVIQICRKRDRIPLMSTR